MKLLVCLVILAGAFTMRLMRPVIENPDPVVWKDDTEEVKFILPEQIMNHPSRRLRGLKTVVPTMDGASDNSSSGLLPGIIVGAASIFLACAICLWACDMKRKSSYGKDPSCRNSGNGCVVSTSVSDGRLNLVGPVPESTSADSSSIPPTSPEVIMEYKEARFLRLSSITASDCGSENQDPSSSSELDEEEQAPVSGESYSPHDDSRSRNLETFLIREAAREHSSLDQFNPLYGTPLPSIFSGEDVPSDESSLETPIGEGFVLAPEDEHSLELSEDDSFLSCGSISFEGQPSYKPFQQNLKVIVFDLPGSCTTDEREPETSAFPGNKEDRADPEDTMDVQLEYLLSTIPIRDTDGRPVTPYSAITRSEDNVV